MNPMTRTIVTVTVLSLILCGCLEFLPKYQETEWHIRTDGTVLLKEYMYDLYYTGSSTSGAIKTFISIINNLEPPILTPTPDKDDTNVIFNLRELQDKYGGLNWMQEVVAPLEKVLEAYDIETENGYYWMEFKTNEVIAETNGETITDPNETDKLIVRWPTNTTFIWYKTTTIDDDKGISFIEFWREYCAVGRDITLLTNKLSGIE